MVLVLYECCGFEIYGVELCVFKLVIGYVDEVLMVCFLYG